MSGGTVLWRQGQRGLLDLPETSESRVEIAAQASLHVARIYLGRRSPGARPRLTGRLGPEYLFIERGFDTLCVMGPAPRGGVCTNVGRRGVYSCASKARRRTGSTADDQGSS